MKFLGFVLMVFMSTAQANEAVESLSGEFLIGYTDSSTKSMNDFSSITNEKYSATASVTSAIPNTQYLGFSLSGSTFRDHQTNTYAFVFPPSGWNVNTEDWTGDINIFARNPNLGSVVLGYTRSHENYKVDLGASNSPPYYIPYAATTGSHDSSKAYAKTEYFTDQFTASLRFAESDWGNRCCNDTVGTASAKWYVKDTFSLTAATSHHRIELPSDFIGVPHTYYSYGLNAEIQPEYFSDKLRLSLNHQWRSTTDFRTTTASASYYYSDYTFLNSTPALEIAYGYTYFDHTYTNALMFQVGLMFDNRISLKDRDRKYLLSTGDQ
jgi:hypothetical protein